MTAGKSASRDWRKLARSWIPTRGDWLGLASLSTSYVLLVCALLVVAAKWSVLGKLKGFDTGLATKLELAAPDIAFYGFFAAVFALGESVRRRMLAATVPLTVLLAIFALINALYLSTTGDQLTIEAFRIGIERAEEVVGIVGEGGVVSLSRLALVLFVVAVPLAAMLWRRKHRDDRSREETCRGRARSALSIGLVGAVLALVLPSSDAIPLRALQGNATLTTYGQWIGGEDDARDVPSAGADPTRWFAGYEPQRLASPARAKALATATRPNVVLVVLESVRRDFTSLAGKDSPAKTPNLSALAARGTEASRARAVMPHTSKSLFSIHCGRLPLMQRRNYEAAANAPLQCLPGLLREAGYDTIFMQTALGAFEDRPRLVESMGFAEFRAWEEIQGAPVGYFSSDDESLVPAFGEWLANARDKDGQHAPFFATLLTSTTHHPYRLTEAAKERAKASGAKASTDAERYARLIESQDHALGALLELLKERDLEASTLVVVVGDHGEGFGAKGIRQHDNTFFEEGLRVPLVIAGPGVDAMRVDHNASLVDIVPTLAELIGVPLEPAVAQALPGHSLFAAPGDAPRDFACYFDGYCYGYVLGDRKLVIAKDGTMAFYFDLSRDPEELDALPLDEALAATVPALLQRIDAHRMSGPRLLAPLRARYGDWACPEQEPCRHPKNPEDFFFEGR